MAERKLVCVQGLGFVGAAMAVAVAKASSQGKFLYDVVGVDLNSPMGNERVNAINDGVLAFESKDEILRSELRNAVERGNLKATTDEKIYQKADVIIVDVPLDLDFSNPREKIDVNLNPFKGAIKTLATNVKPGALIIVETTVPPGTCENVVQPIFEEEFKKRGLSVDQINIAHSYERVMPGRDYLKSITDYWRVFSGLNERSGDECQKFLETIINTKDFPMTRLDRTVASETSKVLENSYRAMTIAFMEEWGRFAERVGFDLFEVIDAIRMRPTHSNMRTPGFGVGGYCLTKDPLFASWAAQNYFGEKDLEFPFCLEAVETNQKMPFVSYEYGKKILGSYNGKNIWVYGVSYRQDVGDTRYSPTEPFVKKLLSEGANVKCIDPLVEKWHEVDVSVYLELEPNDEPDMVFFCVPHEAFEKLSFKRLNSNAKVIDTNRVLTLSQICELRELGLELFSIGRGMNK